MKLRKLIGDIGAKYDRMQPMSSEAQRLLSQAEAEFKRWIPSGYLVEASGGKTKPAVTPRIAILNPAETTTTRHGMHIAYLLAADNSTVTLTLNQGAGEMTEHLGRAGARLLLALEAATIRAALRPKDIGDLDIFFDLRATAASSLDLQHANIVSRTYRLDSLPRESRMMADLQRFVRLYIQALDAREAARRSGRLELLTPARNAAAKTAANAAAETAAPAAAPATAKTTANATAPATASVAASVAAKTTANAAADTAGKTATETPAEPEPKPSAKPSAKSTTKPAAKLSAKPAAKPVAKPVAKPAKPPNKPSEKPSDKPLDKGKPSDKDKPSEKPAAKPATSQALELAAKPTAKPAVTNPAEPDMTKKKSLPAAVASKKGPDPEIRVDRKKRTLTRTVTRRSLLAALAAAPIAWMAPVTKPIRNSSAAKPLPRPPQAKTVWTIDVSQHDWNRQGGNLDWSSIRAAGISGMCARATYGDPAGYHWPTYRFGDFARSSKKAGMGLRGGYHNLVRGDQESINRQVDWLRRELDRHDANWAMLDVERYSELVKADMWPTWDDVRRFDDRWAALENRVLVGYIPPWNWSKFLGQPDLRDFRGPLIASNYPLQANEDFRSLYEQISGNDGRGWASYGNRVPEGWQYSSRAKVPGAPYICDINAWRVGYDQLKAILLDRREPGNRRGTPQPEA